MAGNFEPFQRLKDAQLRASSPRHHAALSASAGTGKTHVLTARVLRLLLADVPPSSILCLTFTKAGAAEMAQRIHARLAAWVRLKDSLLGKELDALDEDVTPEMRTRARTLFARVLDAPGGLRIQTIHSFAQSLLAAFPAEAGLIPGFRPMEEREQQQLGRATLADLLVRAEEGGDLGLIRDVQALSLRLGEKSAEDFLRCCARAPEAMADLGPREGIEARLRNAFDLPLGNIEDAIERECGDELFDVAALRRIGALNASWGTKSGLERADLCAAWCAASPKQRTEMLEKLNAVWAKADGESRSFGKGQAPQDAEYAELAAALFECCGRMLRMRKLAVHLAELAAGLRAGQAFAAAYREAKRAAGAVDFDDLIRWAEELLHKPGMGDWVRYKLDQQTDHILVDEAQDTNARQWSIVEALVAEYFAGEGALGRLRTIFTVGDFKQAIFGFQGTNPREFERARAYFEAKAKLIRSAAEEAGLSEPELPPDFLDLAMDRSFRSSPEILDLVDAVIGELGHQALGLVRPPNPHVSHHHGRPGSVTLWHAFDNEAQEEEGEEGWIPETVRAYAGKLARQVRAWLDAPFFVESKDRPLRPEDILILVRRRSDLASLLVARLHAENVPVAGIDRLSLSAPLAVQDLLAAARFAVQPLDDLNLASLLVSPLFGWSQDDLYRAAFGRKGALWPHLRDAGLADPATVEGLRSLLNMADLATPHVFFETILSGPMEGRRKLLKRLGPEARDPIEELLSSALDFEDNASPALQPFLDWFVRGDVEIVRDPSAPLDAVRVMTVHGAKGLQAPVVILADACVDPQRSRSGLAELELAEGAEAIPVIRPRKDEMAEPLKSQIEAQDRQDREEHWRLLYVALTRAEERLYVGGALSPADRGQPPEASWYRAVETALGRLGSDWAEDQLWTRALTLGAQPRPAAVLAPADTTPSSALPDWVRRPAPAEERPPRPLAPSAPAEEEVASAPPDPDQRRAALRGKLLHQLFERLAGVEPARRSELAQAWLERSAGVAEPDFRRTLIADACAVIDHPDYAELFGADALAEAPIAAVIESGAVVSGTVDRLLVRLDRIRIVDFKTGRRVPDGIEDIPAAHLRQMAVYAAALRVIFPGRAVEAALLYTSAPVLHALPDALLRAHLPAGG